MITLKLKTILSASGCTLVLYESSELANLQTDRSDQLDVIGLIIQPKDVILEVKANAILEHFNPMTIEIMQQVRLEDNADNNEVQFQALLDICKVVILRLINDAEFKTLRPITALKIPEQKYDANVIGWSMPLDLYYLKNENKDPCL